MCEGRGLQPSATNGNSKFVRLFWLQQLSWLSSSYCYSRSSPLLTTRIPHSPQYQHATWWSMNPIPINQVLYNHNQHNQMPRGIILQCNKVTLQAITWIYLKQYKNIIYILMFNTWEGLKYNQMSSLKSQKHHLKRKSISVIWLPMTLI